MDQKTDRRTAGIRRGPRRLATAAMLALTLVLSACDDDAAQPTASVTLPASFPKAEVPLVEGNLIDAGERAQGAITVYNVTVQAKPGGYAEAKKKLTAAGYLALGDGPEGATASAQFSGKGYIVTVSTVTGDAIPNAVYYLVSKA